MRGLVITPDGGMSLRNFAEPLHKTLGQAVGGWIEAVHPRNLPAGYCMYVNEEGLLENLPVNPIGCALYGTHRHGQPIVGTLVILRDGWNDEGEMIAEGLDEEDRMLLCEAIGRAREEACGGKGEA